MKKFIFCTIIVIMAVMCGCSPVNKNDDEVGLQAELFCEGQQDAVLEIKEAADYDDHIYIDIEQLEDILRVQFGDEADEIRDMIIYHPDLKHYSTGEIVGQIMTGLSCDYCDEAFYSDVHSSDGEYNDKQQLNNVDFDYLEEIPIYDGGNYDKELCFSGDCQNIVDEYGKYCQEHVCLKTGCTMERLFSSNYCILHACNTFGCENPQSGYGSYCAEHTCQKQGCIFEKSTLSEYCSSHQCSSVGCENSRTDYGFYCSEHECAKSGCTSERGIMSDYCYFHEEEEYESSYWSEEKCSKFGCDSPKAIMSDYCLLHKID
ncbi:MAG: hypothetical protein IJA67_05955 [Oscillospiraceae bacterium]|nr:hypothetical protein [Oscillospiraceae bacterium]